MCLGPPKVAINPSCPCSDSDWISWVGRPAVAPKLILCPDSELKSGSASKSSYSSKISIGVLPCGARRPIFGDFGLSLERLLFDFNDTIFSYGFDFIYLISLFLPSLLGTAGLRRDEIVLIPDEEGRVI